MSHVFALGLCERKARAKARFLGEGFDSGLKPTSPPKDGNTAESECPTSSPKGRTGAAEERQVPTLRQA